jgi:hypothetical protein
MGWFIKKYYICWTLIYLQRPLRYIYSVLFDIKLGEPRIFGESEQQRLVLSPRAKPITEFRSSRSSPIIFATTATGDSDGDGNLNVLRGSHWWQIGFRLTALGRDVKYISRSFHLLDREEASNSFFPNPVSTISRHQPWTVGTFQGQDTSAYFKVVWGNKGSDSNISSGLV